MTGAMDRRRVLIAMAGAFGAVSLPNSASRGNGPQRQVRPADQGRRGARPEPAAARRARHRHPQRRHRSGRGGHPRRARAASARRIRALVTPGLIDLHAHTFPYGSAIGIPADELVPFQGTTTAVSAGDAGANNFAAFRRFIVGVDAHAPLRVRAHRQHRAGGLPGRRSSTTSTTRSRRSRRGRSRRTPTSCSASRCACRRT